MKPWWKSRTIWFNTAAGGVAFMAADTGVTHHLPDWIASLYGTVVAAANVGLRFITTDPIVAQKLNDTPPPQ